MVKRALGLTLLLALLTIGALAAPAIATEGGEAVHHEYEDIAAGASDVGAEFLPEEYTRPPFFDWFVFPLIGAGVLISALIVARYLAWQPRFAREAREKSKR